LLCQVSPLGIQNFYKFQFLFPTSSLELFFSCDGEFYIFEVFIINTEFTTVFFTKSFESSIFMFFDSS
jgi:hypothetical protein